MDAQATATAVLDLDVDEKADEERVIEQLCNADGPMGIFSDALTDEEALRRAVLLRVARGEIMVTRNA